MVSSTISARAALAPREQRVIVRAEHRGEVGQDLVDLVAYGRDWSVASWARFSFEAATNCIARVICLMLRDRADAPPDLALAGHARLALLAGLGQEASA